jgi:hypothetical protein
VRLNLHASLRGRVERRLVLLGECGARRLELVRLLRALRLERDRARLARGLANVSEGSSDAMVNTRRARLSEKSAMETQAYQLPLGRLELCRQRCRLGRESRRLFLELCEARLALVDCKEETYKEDGSELKNNASVCWQRALRNDTYWPRHALAFPRETKRIALSFAALAAAAI